MNSHRRNEFDKMILVISDLHSIYEYDGCYQRRHGIAANIIPFREFSAEEKVKLKFGMKRQLDNNEQFWNRQDIIN